MRAGDEFLEVLTAAPRRRIVVVDRAKDLMRSGGGVESRLRVDRSSRVTPVELVAQAVPDDCVPAPVDAYSAVSPVAQDGDERRGSTEADMSRLCAPGPV